MAMPQNKGDFSLRIQQAMEGSDDGEAVITRKMMDVADCIGMPFWELAEKNWFTGFHLPKLLGRAAKG